MADRLRTTIRALGELFDGPHATPVRREKGPYFLNISSLKSGRLDLGESDHVSAEDFTKWTRRVTPRANDLLFSYETRLGEAALMPAGVEACLGRRMALLRPDLSVVDPRFLLYFYLSPSFQRTIQKHMIHGATVPRIGLAKMPDWEVLIPQLPEQKAIGEVLGALDDKIAANQSCLRLSDGLCAALVSRASAQGERVRLRDLMVLHYGKSLPATQRRPGDVVVLGSGGPTGLHDSALVERSGVVLGRKGTVGAVYWAPGPHFPIDTTYYVEPLGDFIGELLYYLLRTISFSDMNSDSAVPGLNRDEAYAQNIRVPSDPATVTAELRVQFDLAAAVRRESAALTAMRDDLLPLLMSGKVHVKDAEESVEGVL